MFDNQPLQQPERLFGQLLAPMVQPKEELTVENHRIPGLKAVSTLLLPSDELLTATATGDAVTVSNRSKDIAHLAIPEEFSVRSVQLFTLARYQRTEIWMGLVCQDRKGRSFDVYERLGKDGAFDEQTLDPYLNPCASGVYAMYTDQHAKVQEYDRVPPPSAARNFFYTADSSSGESRTALCRSREGSDSWIMVKEWSQQISTCALTSNPRRIAIGFHNGDVAVHRLKQPGELESEGSSLFNLHRFGFKQGSRATALEFAAFDPAHPTRRDALIIGTNLSEIGCVDVSGNALVSIDEGSSRAGERIQSVRVDPLSGVHAYYGDS